MKYNNHTLYIICLSISFSIILMAQLTLLYSIYSYYNLIQIYSVYDNYNDTMYYNYIIIYLNNKMTTS